jgi:hypothetical protein
LIVVHRCLIPPNNVEKSTLLSNLSTHSGYPATFARGREPKMSHKLILICGQLHSMKTIDPGSNLRRLMCRESKHKNVTLKDGEDIKTRRE